MENYKINYLNRSKCRATSTKNLAMWLGSLLSALHDLI